MILARVPLIVCTLGICPALISHRVFAQSGDVRFVHDPSIIGREGRYTIVSTGHGIPIRVSTDLMHWERRGAVFPGNVPDWAKREIPRVEFPWAPDVSFFNDEYHVYYSISTFGSQRSAIGLATNETLDTASPRYHWVDRGKVIESVPGKDRFNAIDPNIVIDERGMPWLSFGSFCAGIVIVPIDPRTGKLLHPEKEPILIAARPSNQAIEAPFIIAREGSFYLFASVDFCCRGTDSDYKIVVGRSSRVTGPYLGLAGRPMTQGGGSLLLAGHGRVRGPGHNSVLSEGGSDYLVHHFYDAEDAGIPRLQIRRLAWDADQFPLAGEPIRDLSAKPLGQVALIKRVTTGQWMHSVEFGPPWPIRFLPGGTINEDQSRATWSVEGARLKLRWPRQDTPGSTWTDACILADDGRSYVGRNQNHLAIRGTRSAE